MKNYKKWKRRIIKSPTVSPAFIERIKGRRDATKGETVCDAYVSRLYSKTAAIEASECMVAENLLITKRKRASTILNSMKSISSVLTLDSDYSAENPIEVRRARQNDKLKLSAEATFKGNMSELCEINEDITTVATILIERTNKTRNKAASKIGAYIMGVKSTLPDYKPTIEGFDKTNVVVYFEKHKSLDEAIQKAVEIKGDTNND